jgi:glycosyltransferase involved in cell wall biosynthesis
MRLLFVHEVNWRRKVVYEIHDFPELLAARGHEVVFIDYPEDDRPQGLARIVDLRTKVQHGATRAHDGPGIEVRTPGRVLPPPLDRLVASLTHVPEIRGQLRRGRFDAVVLYGVPTNGWQTVGLAHRYGVPVLFRAIDISHGLRPTAYGSLIKRAESFVYRHADAISANNVGLARYCEAHGARPSAISVDYPGLDLDRFRPGVAPEGLGRRYGLAPEHRVVCFMGTLYRFAGLDWFVEGFAEHLRARTDLRLLLIGGGEAEADLRSRVDRLGVADKVVFTGFVGYSDLADHLRLADVAINPFLSDLVTENALPGKVLQYLGCGLPTVCTPLAGMQGMVPEGAGVIYRELGSPFIEAVADLVADHHAVNRLGAEGRSAVERLCDWDACTDRFEQAIHRAIAAHARSGAEV